MQHWIEQTMKTFFYVMELLGLKKQVNSTKNLLYTVIHSPIHTNAAIRKLAVLLKTEGNQKKARKTCR